MVTSLARQSIIIKCRMQKSVITGSYEYYYAAGLFSKLCGIEIPEEIKPPALTEFLRENGKDAELKDEKEAYLKKILLEYEPHETYDEQMKELLLWGKNEEHIWD